MTNKMRESLERDARKLGIMGSLALYAVEYGDGPYFYDDVLEGTVNEFLHQEVFTEGEVYASVLKWHEVAARAPQIRVTVKTCSNCGQPTTMLMNASLKANVCGDCYDLFAN